ncbi:MAG: TonB family protein [Acidobacteriia bacterium]|nr:TonB family protein [Terriglobia bacterium]
MTLTTKETSQLNSLAKPGSTPESSESNSIQNPRSNPVCLELPVTIRSLPGEKGETSSEPAKSNREEARTVIVFDNGAVLRIAGNFPPGQTIIVTNPQGRDVVCRVGSARNLPTVKGYIEVEFIEPVNNFWGIHQSTKQTSASNPPTPVLAQPQVVPSEPVPAPPTPPRVAPTVTQTIAPSGDAPSFEDIAGLVRMWPPPTTLGRALKSAPRPGALKNDELAQGLVAAEKPASPVSVTTPAADPPPFSTKWESPSVPVRKLSPPSDFLGKSILSSSRPSSVSSSSGSRGRMPLMLAAAVAVLVGFGVGFFFRNRGNVVSTSASVPAVTQSSTPSLPAAANVPEPAVNAQSVVDQASPLSPAVFPVSSTSTDSVVDPGSSVSQAPRRPANNVDAKQPVRLGTPRQPIPDLKMSAPTAASRNSGKLVDGSVPGITDLASAGAASGAPAGAMLSPIGHTESQPAPPPPGVGSSGSSARVVHDPKLISSTRPLYPELAKQSNVQGVVVVFAQVDASGNVTGTKAISGPILLRQAAVDAVRHWKYDPAIINGKPAAAQVTVSIDFHLNQ